MFAGNAGKRFKARTGGGLHAIRSLEATHGPNGWHPHIHVLFLTERPMSDDEVLIAADWLYERWAVIIERELGEPHIPSPERGTDFRPARKAEYLAKLGLELSDPGFKRGRQGGRSPMQILFDWCEDDSDRDLALFRHYAEAMKGRQFLTWPKKGAVYELKKQMQDALEADKDAEPERPPIAALADCDCDWDDIRHKQDDIAVSLLETAEKRGLSGVLELVRHHLGEDAVRRTVGMTGWHQRDALRAQAPPVKVELAVTAPPAKTEPVQMELPSVSTCPSRCAGRSLDHRVPVSPLAQPVLERPRATLPRP